MEFHSEIRQSVRQLLEKSALPSEDYRPLPDAYYCPITSELIYQPVIVPEGNTFEPAAIQHWIDANHNSPLSRTPLEMSDLYDNTALKNLLETESSKDEDEMHPSIRRWKQETTEEPSFNESERATGYPTTHEQLEQFLLARRTRRNCTIFWIFDGVRYTLARFTLFGSGSLPSCMSMLLLLYLDGR